MKKVNFFYMAAVVAATAMMTSCGNDDNEVTNPNRVAVQFSSSITDLQTRVADQNWAASDSIGIYMLKTPFTLAAGNISESVDNRQYKADGAGLSVSFSPVTTGTEIYYPVAGDVKFIAYYPYAASLTDYKLPIDVSSAKQGNQSAIDVLYAPAGTSYNKNSGTVALPFAHKLVKLVFNISNDASVTTPLTGLSVSISEQSVMAELDLADGTVSLAGPAVQTAIAAKVSTDGTAAEAIVLPSAQSGTFTFTNSIGEAFTADIPDAAFVGGNKYTYTVTLKKTEAVITGTIAPWGTIGGGGVDAY
jgi:hypothetical protein